MSSDKEEFQELIISEDVMAFIIAMTGCEDVEEAIEAYIMTCTGFMVDPQLLSDFLEAQLEKLPDVLQ